MGGILLLLLLCLVMAVASFLAGALPLSMTLSQSQLRLISSIGVGILVGTSLIVIIPEGIEAIATTTSSSHSHSQRHYHRSLRPSIRWAVDTAASVGWEDVAPVQRAEGSNRPPTGVFSELLGTVSVPIPVQKRDVKRDEAKDDKQSPEATPKQPESVPHDEHGQGNENNLPTFFIGFSMTLGFVLMFLIDRLPRHATDRFQSAPATRHISLDNLASSSVSGEEESEGFLESLAPSPRQSRGLATTIGLVIHAAADGIAMGASATTSDMKLGLIIFVAIMIHKAPAAFGLTSILLKQGLSKRAARGHLIVFSLAAPFGALATYILVSLLGGGKMEGESGQWWTGMLLLFSAGTFLYVAMHAMQEDGHSHGGEHQPGANGYADGSHTAQRKQARPEMRDTVATVVGMLLPLLTQFGHHH